MSNFFDDFEATQADSATRAVSSDSLSSAEEKTIAIATSTVVTAVIAAVVSALLVICFFYFRMYWGGDYEGEGSDTTVVVTIPEGATGSQIATILAKKDVVKSEGAFERVCKADSRCSSIQPGTYTLKKKMSAKNALIALLDPANKAEIKITIPEGFTKDQVYERIASVLNISRDDVVAAAADTAALGLPDVAGGNIEGWIAPLTYTFEPGTSATDVLRAMVAARLEQMNELGIPQDAWQETLIKASIVEREVFSPEDYAKVARVIDNRLADTEAVQGRLQMDSTVLYGVGKTGGSPTQSELDQDTPYNTYLHAGLPPSPISNPGMAALEGVRNPADGDWLYFVTVNLDTGETKFASTLAEHDEYVKEYRAWLAENPQ